MIRKNKITDVKFILRSPFFHEIKRAEGKKGLGKFSSIVTPNYTVDENEKKGKRDSGRGSTV